METINIKFDEKQLEDLVKKVTENIIKKTKEDSVTELTHKESEKRVLMYLEFNETHSKSKDEKIYFGFAYNTLSKEYATEFNLDFKTDVKKVIELKSQGWKEEVIYK